MEKLEGEEWRPIVDPPTDERYRISNKGRVYDTVGEKFLNWHDNGGGYKIVGLRRKGHVNTLMRYVHRLVGIHFIDNPNNHPQVGHKDHDKENNDVSNLYWTTQKQNTRDGIKAGRINVKERPYTKRLSPRHICAIAIMNKRLAWVNQHTQRQEAIKKANEMNLKGNDYSNYMISFDRQHAAQSIFH